MRMYLKQASLFHSPAALIKESKIPASATVVAAPTLKECLAYKELLKPYTVGSMCTVPANVCRDSGCLLNNTKSSLPGSTLRRVAMR